MLGPCEHQRETGEYDHYGSSRKRTFDRHDVSPSLSCNYEWPRNSIFETGQVICAGELKIRLDALIFINATGH
jgi:hypothetical protein